MTKRNSVYIGLLLLSVLGLGFSWGDILARQMRKGNEAFEAGNYEEALKAYTEADVKSQPDDPRLPQLYNNMGTTFYRQGHYEQAVAMYQKALEASSDTDFQADAFFNSGNSRFKQGNYQKAVEAYDEALERNPQHLRALHNKHVVEQLLEQQPDRSQPNNQDQQPNRKENQQQDGQPREDGEPTPQPTAGPDEQQPQEAQPAEESNHEPERNLSEEEAMRILDALMEKEQLRQEPHQVPPRPVEKDW